MHFDGLDISILGPAFVAGLLVLATHVPMGLRVLGRGIVFIDLAIAQVAGVGIIAADTLGLPLHGASVQFIATGTALSGALLLAWTEKKWPESQEALIGILFVLAASIGIILLSHNPHGGEYLKDLLVGQILWVNLPDLVPIAILYTIVLAVWFSLEKHMNSIAFYLLFAVTVTASVQLVGVYLVFASLIIPALAVIKRTSIRLPLGYALGAAGYAAGLVCSALLDLPTGAVIVCSIAVISAIFAGVAKTS
ncbi:MAG: metal ABC transporter permease [Mariprofundaceae bacterium]|nr:metal ABC transporter permease [Mariprofundaceae bacterium]